MNIQKWSNKHLILKNSRIIYEQNTKDITAVKESLYVRSTRRFSENFCRDFLGSTSILKFFRKQGEKMGPSGLFLKPFKILAIIALSEIKHSVAPVFYI